MPKAKNAKGLSFEDAMRRLEETVDEMESHDMPLENLLKKYEEGIHLIEFCDKKLAAAEQKVEILAKSRAAKPQAAPPQKSSSVKEDPREENEDNSDVELF